MLFYIEVGHEKSKKVLNSFVYFIHEISFQSLTSVHYSIDTSLSVSVIFGITNIQNIFNKEMQSTKYVEQFF